LTLTDIDIITAEAMTLAHQLASGQKTSHDIIDDGFTKHAFKDRDGLPEWFLDDESKHDRPHKPITKTAAAAIKEKLRAYNARPIKKVAEARARKKFKQAQKLEKLKKKADLLAGEEGMSEKEKASSIAKLISSAARKQKRAPIKVVKAAGVNRGLSGRPKGGSYFLQTFPWDGEELTLGLNSQGSLQDGGSTDEEGVAGDEEDLQEEEVDVLRCGMTLLISRAISQKVDFTAHFGVRMKRASKRGGREDHITLYFAVLRALTDFTKLLNGYSGPLKSMSYQ
jgi:hypothetical protein